MHELAAAMLLAVELDSLPVPADGATLSTADAVLHETLSRAHVEHDAYTLFSALMRNGAQAFYAHHPESDAPRVSRAPSAPEAKQPIIKVCDSMWELLGRIDPALKAKLDSEGIEPQLFGMCVLILTVEVSDKPLTRILPLEQSLGPASIHERVPASRRHVDLGRAPRSRPQLGALDAALHLATPPHSQHLYVDESTRADTCEVTADQLYHPSQCSPATTRTA
jgi:hypothetical protein